jgi:hypothetical protein
MPAKLLLTSLFFSSKIQNFPLAIDVANLLMTVATGEHILYALPIPALLFKLILNPGDPALPVHVINLTSGRFLYPNCEKILSNIPMRDK